MENASKALLIAGGILLTMLVLSLLLYAWNIFSEYQTNQDRLQEVEDLAKFNEQFTSYQRDDVLGYELLSLVNKVIDYNQRYSRTGINTNVPGNTAQYTPIKVNIQMWGGDTGLDKNDVESKLATTINIPDEAPEGGTLTLFTNNKYFVNDTTNTNAFGAKGNIGTILYTISDIEGKAQFGGTTGITNLVKNKGSIYEGKVIGYNTGTPNTSDISDIKGWYEKDYILSRYKTLTGYAEYDDIDDIRDDDNIKDVLKYAEYLQFKKAIFKCTGEIKYNEYSGRVEEINFAFTGDLR